MKKLILLAIPVLLLTGCNSDLDETGFYLQDYSYEIQTDKETCVQYIVGNRKLSVRLNADGTPMLNKKCLKEVEE